MVGLLASCADDDAVWKDTGGGSIKLKFTDGLLVSRVADDTPSERAISHLDVFIYKTDGTAPIYERINNPVVTGEDNAGTVTLNASLSDFENRSTNVVYVIANAIETITGLETLDELKAKVQEDRRIHVTGTTASGAPQYFLMDGQASSTENGTPGNINIDYTSTDDIVMYVTLKRAAAKVVVTLEQGTGQYKFLKDEAQNYEKGYYFRHMPYKTMLLEQTGTNAYPSDTYWRIPDKANDNAFEWCKGGENKVVVTAYVYSHQWKDNENEVHTKGTSLVVNIPLWYDTDNDGTVDDGEEVYMNSYYQLPIVNSVEIGGYDTWTINRNTLYTVTATIEAPGAEDNKQPHTLDNLQYTTEEWNPERVNVGGGNSPKYLELNKELVEMHNVDTDATLEFTSSSTINSVTISNAYYYNKYGNMISITDHNSNGMSTSFDNTVLTGVITVNSDVPTNFTARYFTLTVTNVDGETETVDVIQYPVICVSNQLSRYSYRDDFTNNNANGVMTYENYYSGGKVNVSVNVGNNGWGLTYGTGANGGFFASKVRGEANNDGTYKNLRYYYSDGDRFNSAGLKTDQTESNANIRMYRIDVKATSDEYVVGRPRITTDGITDPSWDNQRLVSPSFMIASRLAIITSNGGNLGNLNDGCENNVRGGVKFDKDNSEVIIGSVSVTYDWDGDLASHSWSNSSTAYNINEDQLLEVYADHCKKYVEVDDVGNIYDDWRLPTAAEIQFIVDTQGEGTQNEAIDYLLNGLFYYSACGPVYNSKPNSTGKTIRCVRDVN